MERPCITQPRKWPTKVPPDESAATPDPCAARWSWRRRLLAQWRIKLVATPILMTAFFLAYFFVLKSPIFSVTTMPLIAIDEVVGFAPWTLPVYLSLWVYVLLALTFIAERRELLAYGQAVIGVATVGLGIFLVSPTAVPVPEIDWEAHPTFQFLKTVDATGNACPSLHVAFAVFTAMWLHTLLRTMGGGGLLRLLNWTWCGAIVYSTLATKQHVALDVVAGALLGIAGGAIGLWRAGVVQLRPGGVSRRSAPARAQAPS